MKLKDITQCDDLKEYLLNKGKKHTGGYSHYTDTGALYGMLDNKHFWISRMDQMNDKQEIDKFSIDNWNSIFSMSFIYGSNDNMAMWALYCIPEEEAIRIRFRLKEINKLVKKIKETMIYKDIENYRYAGRIKDIVLVDVLYIDKIEYSTNNYTHVIKRDDESKYFDIYTEGNLQDIQRGDKFAGMLKNAAWSYENEARIRIQLEEDSELKKIAIELTETIFDGALITIGPWADDEKYEEIKGKIIEKSNGRINRDQIKRSGFNGLVNDLRQCSKCNHVFKRRDN